MSSLAERLRAVVRPAPPSEHHVDEATTQSSPGSPSNAVAEVLDGQWQECDGQRFLVVDRRYAPGHRHGRMAVADGLPPSDGVWPGLSLLGAVLPPVHGDAAGTTPLLFVDLETTGLAGGAGTYAFLVGCAWFDGAAFRVRQFFLPSYAAERALLESLDTMARRAAVVVSFNGKTFDLPLIETRFLFHRLVTPFAGLPHVDMLHPARRLWRGRADREPLGAAGRWESDGTAQSGCRLTTLEQTLCGHHREGDVPGFEIPARYFHYVRTGDARPLAAVFEHNRLDLLSLALLTARAAQLIDAGPGAAESAREALGLGQLYERAGRTPEASACYARAAGLCDRSTVLTADSATRAEALRAFALLCRRQRLFEDAASAWRKALDQRGCPPQIVREASEALAVHHEHRLRDPRTARSFALRSLQMTGTVARAQSLQHRLARLERKLGPAPAPLF